ncbi:O-antigen polymerase [Shewanella algae]|uniref:O-antigen polymerase n=1 Tax=Shewanella algae TaxID=38313 RepID=UPI001AACBD4B|nr:O-antigen polymerase [Shewanella algae]MBO2615604.1 oligosaccharide repeat unit polymerase [Shewanella algae]
MYELIVFFSFLFFWVSVSLKYKTYTSPIMFFVLAYCLHTFPGALSLVWLSEIKTSIESKHLAMLWVSITYIAFSIPFFGFNRVKFNSNPTVEISINNRASILIISFMFFMTFKYIYETGAFKALQYALSGDIVSAYLIRTSISNGYGEGQFLATFSFRYLGPLICAIYYAKYLRFKKPEDKNILTLSVLMTLVPSLLLVQKYYIVQLFLILFLVRVFVLKIKLNLAKIIALILLGIVVISLLVIFYKGFVWERLITTPINVFRRIFIVNVDVLSAYAQFYIDGNELFLGAATPNYGNLFPYERFMETRVIFDEYIAKSDNLEAGMKGSAPTNFFGNLLINFDYIGAIIITLFLGTTISIIFKFLEAQIDKGCTFSCGLSAYLTVFIVEIGNGSLFQTFNYITLFNFGIVGSLLIVVLMLRFKIKK